MCEWRPSHEVTHNLIKKRGTRDRANLPNLPFGDKTETASGARTDGERELQTTRSALPPQRMPGFRVWVRSPRGRRIAQIDTNENAGQTQMGRKGGGAVNTHCLEHYECSESDVETDPCRPCGPSRRTIEADLRMIAGGRNREAKG